MTTPAGYSGTPLPTKLGIKPGHRLLLEGAPDGFEAGTLIPMPDGVTVHHRAGRDPYDVVVVFRSSLAEYRRHLPRDIGRIARNGSLWVAWPKKASGVVSDLSDNVVRAEALAAGVVDVKIAAIDPTWSAMKLVYRLADR